MAAAIPERSICWLRRGRLGYVVSPNVLLYGTGGLAWTHFARHRYERPSGHRSACPPETSPEFLDLDPQLRFGWVAGLGAENRLLDTNWLAHLEYLHYDFGNSGSGGIGLRFSQTTGNLTPDVVRAGISYKFGQFPISGGGAGG